MPLNDFFMLFRKQRIEAFGDTAGSVPDDCNKASIKIKWAIIFFLQFANLWSAIKWIAIKWGMSVVWWLVLMNYLKKAAAACSPCPT